MTAQQVARSERDPFAPAFTIACESGPDGPWFDAICDGCQFCTAGHLSADEAQEAARAFHPCCNPSPIPTTEDKNE